MKKIGLIICLLFLLGTVSLYAGKNPVSVKSGKILVLKQPGKVLFEIDDSNAKVGNKTLDAYLEERGADFVRDWPHDLVKASHSFKAVFNKKNKKGAQISSDAEEADYKLIVRIRSMDMGDAHSKFIAMAFAPPSKAASQAGGCIMIGSADIVDLKTNEVVCTLYIDEVKGIGNPSESARFCYMFEELALCIHKLAKKAK